MPPSWTHQFIKKVNTGFQNRFTEILTLDFQYEKMVQYNTVKPKTFKPNYWMNRKIDHQVRIFYFLYLCFF